MPPEPLHTFENAEGGESISSKARDFFIKAIQQDEVIVFMIILYFHSGILHPASRAYGRGSSEAMR